MLYKKLRMWHFPDKYILQPSDDSSDSYLSINRLDGSISLIAQLPESSNIMHSPRVYDIFGVIGIIKILVGSYLLVITKRECVGSYQGHSIYKISGVQILPCTNWLHSSTSEQKKVEAKFSVLLNAAQGMSGLYYSYEAQLTLRLQQLNELNGELKNAPLWKQARHRFVWNDYMLESFIHEKLDSYILPIIQGSFQTFQTAIGSEIINVTLIARRCMRRPGTRTWRRGADSYGNVANFVESEQILQTKDFTTSFVQVRGSMPFLWEQIVDLTYKPNFEIVRPDFMSEDVERHLETLKIYGSVAVVNLMSQHGSEGQLSEKFTEAMQSNQNAGTRYIHFDFDQNCGHVQFEHLSDLYRQIEDFLHSHGYFQMNDKGLEVARQTGIVRTNCIDCLDRTNVTQSIIARNILEYQLKEIGLFGAEDKISDHPYLIESHKILWANHGDEISIQYSGIPASKGDFMRYGTRTLQGIANDGWNAIVGYYLNNFADGTKQDAIDLLNGKFVVLAGQDLKSDTTATGVFGRCVYAMDLLHMHHRDLKFYKGALKRYASFLWSLTHVFLAPMVAFLVLPEARYNLLKLSLFLACSSMGIVLFVLNHGRDFLNKPRLSRY